MEKHMVINYSYFFISIYALCWMKTCYRFVKCCFIILRQEVKTGFCTRINPRWKYKGYFYNFFCAAALFIMSNTNYTAFFFIFMWYSHWFLSTIVELYHTSLYAVHAHSWHAVLGAKCQWRWQCKLLPTELVNRLRKGTFNKQMQITLGLFLTGKPNHIKSFEEQKVSIRY